MKKRFHRLLQRKLHSIVDRITSITVPTLIGVGITASYVSLLIYLIVGPLFRIHHFQCDTSDPSEVCPDYILPELAKHQHQLIYMLMQEELSKTLERGVPQAERIDVTIKWPDTLATHIV